MATPLTASSSQGSLYSSPSQSSLNDYATPGGGSIASSPLASSSRVSFDLEDEENATITASRTLSKKLGKQRSQDDLRLLAVSTHMTELSYAISDIQTRIFEIQELRHKSQSTPENADSSITAVIDQSLMSLDERLESVQKGMEAVNETLDPLLRTAATPTVSETGEGNENAALLRKHATLQSEWESVQDESEVLREELKEDKWLTVFRTVTDQADGMMSSLEKAVNRCQEFIWQVHRRGMDDFQSNAALPSSRSEKLPVTLETFTSILDSYEAKKKHYMPATSKVLSIIDKGVRDRVTKNGETLRRHAESAQRWKSLRDRITRTDAEMENTRKILLGGESDDRESTASGTSTKNGFLTTRASAPRLSSRVSSSTSTSASGSMSPFRKFAQKITGSTSKPTTPAVTPLTVSKKLPTSEPPPATRTIRRQRTSIFSALQNASIARSPATPEKPGHKHTSSTPDTSPLAVKIDRTESGSTTSLASRPNTTQKQRWNSSTKIETEDRNNTIKLTPKRPPSSTGYFSSSHHDDIPPVPPLGTPGRRSLSRMSMASSRPWSPISTSNSTTYSSTHHFNHPPVSMSAFRTPSRAPTPSRGLVTPGLIATSAATPRSRPKTPSHIPAPAKNLRTSSGVRSVGGWDDDDPGHPFKRFPASPSASGSSPPPQHPPRPPSRSMIPIPSVHLHTPSRPSSSMSNFTRNGAESPTFGRGFRGQALRAQTPEHTLRARAQQVPVFQGTPGRPKPSSLSSSSKLPPSSFRADGSGTASRPPSRSGTASRPQSRSGSRAGAYTPILGDQLPLHEYGPPNPLDPLDMEVAAIVNSLPHGLLVERIDPPLRKNQVPKEGEEIKAQYAFSNTLSKKTVTCRLTTMTRASKAGGDAGTAGASTTTTTKKVMCRVGGGWQDLTHFILNRQAGLS